MFSERYQKKSEKIASLVKSEWRFSSQRVKVLSLEGVGRFKKNIVK